MARLVIHEATGPTKIQVGDSVIKICRCGLTKNAEGRCDDSHHKTEDETKDTLYMYHEDGSRYVIEEADDEEFQNKS